MLVGGITHLIQKREHILRHLPEEAQRVRIDFNHQPCECTSLKRRSHAPQHMALKSLNINLGDPCGLGRQPQARPHYPSIEWHYGNSKRLSSKSGVISQGRMPAVITACPQDHGCHGIPQGAFRNGKPMRQAVSLPRPLHSRRIFGHRIKCIHCNRILLTQHPVGEKTVVGADIEKHGSIPNPIRKNPRSRMLISRPLPVGGFLRAITQIQVDIQIGKEFDFQPRGSVMVKCLKNAMPQARKPISHQGAQAIQPLPPCCHRLSPRKHNHMIYGKMPNRCRVVMKRVGKSCRVSRPS